MASRKQLVTKLASNTHACLIGQERKNDKIRKKEEQMKAKKVKSVV